MSEVLRELAEEVAIYLRSGPGCVDGQMNIFRDRLDWLVRSQQQKRQAKGEANNARLHGDSQDKPTDRLPRVPIDLIAKGSRAPALRFCVNVLSTSDYTELPRLPANSAPGTRTPSRTCQAHNEFCSLQRFEI